MPRRPRHIPANEDGVLVEVSSRTIGSRTLLRPSPHVRDVTVGALGRACEVSPLEICGVAFLNSHFHLLVVVREQQQLSRFMQHLMANLTKEIGRLTGWEGSMWSRRYDGIVVSDEPAAQWARLKYVLAHGVKEGLVESPFEWPGVHAARALADREPLEGHWFHRTKEWAARCRGEIFDPYDYATRYQLELSPLPAFRHLSPEEYRERIVELIREIEREGAEARAGRPALGAHSILQQNPSEPPKKTSKRSPKPRFHVRDREVRRKLQEELDAFLIAYRAASATLLSGRRGSPYAEALAFPPGCYPPSFPFVGAAPPPCPPSPPTRSIQKLKSGVLKRGEVPVVRLAGYWGAASARARGHPP